MFGLRELPVVAAGTCAAALLVLSGCSATGSVATPNPPAETPREEPSPEQAAGLEEQPDVLPPPALPAIPAAFETQIEKILKVLDSRGYDTNTGELGSATSQSLVLTPIAPNSNLPDFFLRLQWNTSVPLGDARTTGTRNLANFTLGEIGTGEVWFLCGDMLVLLRADLSVEAFDDLATGLYSESC